jgi:RNA polymerase sigma factor (sigma-70 family)
MTSIPEPIVYLVDDDAAVRDALSLLLTFRGFGCRTFVSAESFLDAWQPDWRGCLLLDLRLEGMDGLQLQQTLAERGSLLPVIFLTGHGDVAHARTALKGGAIDFLEKPVEDTDLLAAVREALAREAAAWQSADLARDIQARIERLTERERQVLERTVAGLQNREIAAELEISPRTVEVFKARMMEKMQARSLPELVRLWLQSRPDYVAKEAS